jgi:hypothetical protein
VLVLNVPSLTTAGVWYAVRRENPGQPWTCECPAFAFGKRDGKQCPHTRIVGFVERRLELCHATHGGPEGHLCRRCVVALTEAWAKEHRRLERMKKKGGGRGPRKQ